MSDFFGIEESLKNMLDDGIGKLEKFLESFLEFFCFECFDFSFGIDIFDKRYFGKWKGEFFLIIFLIENY